MGVCFYLTNRNTHKMTLFFFIIRRKTSLISLTLTFRWITPTTSPVNVSHDFEPVLLKFPSVTYTHSFRRRTPQSVRPSVPGRRTETLGPAPNWERLGGDITFLLLMSQQPSKYHPSVTDCVPFTRHFRLGRMSKV